MEETMIELAAGLLVFAVALAVIDRVIRRLSD